MAGAPGHRGDPAAAAGIVPLPRPVPAGGVRHDAAPGRRDQRTAVQPPPAPGEGGGRLIQPLAIAAAPAAAPGAAGAVASRQEKAHARADADGARRPGRSPDAGAEAASRRSPVAPSAGAVRPHAGPPADAPATPIAHLSQVTAAGERRELRQAARTQASPRDGRAPNPSAVAAAVSTANAVDAAIGVQPSPSPWSTTQAGPWPRPSADGRPESQILAARAQDAHALLAPPAQRGGWPELPDEEWSTGHALAGGPGRSEWTAGGPGLERWPELPDAVDERQDDAREPVGAEQLLAQRRRLADEQRGQPWNA
jgi:hypothetical protein